MRIFKSAVGVCISLGILTGAVPLLTPQRISAQTGSVPLATILNFAETWDRNWNFGGHSVDARFDESYGKWDYNDATYEPWLFDRPTVGYRLFELTGDSRWRDKFLADFAWYRTRIDAQGIFVPKGYDDTKYSYVTPFVLYERLTGDQQYRPIARRIYDAWLRDWNTGINPRTAAYWTEREAAFSLEAAVAWFELTQDQAALTRARAVVENWTAASIDGAPQVTETQHEGGGPAPQALTHSPWMSALYFQALRRYYAASSDPLALQQASAWFDWCDVNCFYPGELASQEWAGLYFVRYLTDVSNAGVGDSGPDEGNLYHCLDTKGTLAFVRKAKVARGESVSRVDLRDAHMTACANRGFANLTRTATYLPKYRVNPPRMANWWIRGYYEVVASSGGTAPRPVAPTGLRIIPGGF